MTSPGPTGNSANYSQVSTKEMDEEKKDLEMAESKGGSSMATKGGKDSGDGSSDGGKKGKRGSVAAAADQSPQQLLWSYSKTGDGDAIRRLVQEYSSSGPNVLDIHKQDRSKYGAHSTALHYACANGNVAVVKLLHSLQAGIDALNKFLSTPLHIACAHGYLEIVEYLIQQRANTEAKNVIENTPLHCAVYNGHTDVVKVLLNANPDPKRALQQPNGVGQTPIRYAHHQEVKDLIKTYFPSKDGAAEGDGLVASSAGTSEGAQPSYDAANTTVEEVEP